MCSIFFSDRAALKGLHENEVEGLVFIFPDQLLFSFFFFLNSTIEMLMPSKSIQLQVFLTCLTWCGGTFEAGTQ